jgi:hypothetical protein
VARAPRQLPLVMFLNVWTRATRPRGLQLLLLLQLQLQLQLLLQLLYFYN